MKIIKKEEVYDLRFNDNSGSIGEVRWTPVYQGFVFTPNIKNLEYSELKAIIQFMEKLQNGCRR